MPLTKHVRHVVRYRNGHVYAGKYDGAGGSPQEDLQKAQVYGWARRARDKLAIYAARPDVYEIIPVRITPIEE